MRALGRNRTGTSPHGLKLKPYPRPRDISSRSLNLKARRDRARGSMPPVTASTEPACLLSAAQSHSASVPPSSGAIVHVSHDGLIRDDLFWACHILHCQHPNIRCCDDRLNAPRCSSRAKSREVSVFSLPGSGLFANHERGRAPVHIFYWTDVSCHERQFAWLAGIP
jgi:hypothetical protein